MCRPAGPTTPQTCVSLANNRYHAVRFLSLPTSEPNGIPGMATAVQWSLTNVYNPTDLNAIPPRNQTPILDVLVQSYDYGNLNGLVAWTDCVPWNTGQGGSHPNRWCRGQYITYNSFFYWSNFGYYDTDAQRRNVACHEMGHTIGLRCTGSTRIHVHARQQRSRDRSGPARQGARQWALLTPRCPGARCSAGLLGGRPGRLWERP